MSHGPRIGARGLRALVGCTSLKLLTLSGQRDKWLDDLDDALAAVAALQDAAVKVRRVLELDWDYY